MGRPGVSHAPDHFQQEAIACRDRGIRIVAPAGSGKTETLARRASARIESGIAPDRILIVTFDNTAKRSLDGYLRASVSGGQMPRVRTLNQLGNEILRRHFPKERHPIIGAEQRATLQRRFKPCEDDLPVLEWDGVRRWLVGDVFESLKNQGFAPGRDRDKVTRWLRHEYLRLPDLDESASVDDFWGMPSNAIETDAYESQLLCIGDLYAKYDRACRELGVMDFTDQKLRAFYALNGDDGVREQVRAGWDEIVIDESQDLNRIDALLIWAMLGEAATLVLAGDDDQTLYEFRNAHSLYLREPERFFRDRSFTTINLNVNYRSPQTILDAANALIAHNVERLEKSPVSGVKDPGAISLLPASSAGEHTRQLAGLVREELAAGRRPNDIAFLCHDEDTRRQMLAVLRQARIPIFNDDRRSGPLVQSGVEVITFRRAKGQQWPIVILPNCNDRVLPDDRSVREGLLESVRRQYYVAMTRASWRLVIGYVRSGEQDIIHRTGNGEVVATNGASRFLFEAGLVGQQEPAVEGERVVEGAGEPGAPAGVPVATPAPQPAPEPAAPASAEPATKVDVVVVPAPPAPSPEPMPKRTRRATKPWDVRQRERQWLAKSQERLAKEDYAYALLDSWKVIEAIMTRVVRMPAGSTDVSMARIIDRAVETGQIEREWASRLHTWRKERNRSAAHPGEENRDVVQEAVSLTPDFLAYFIQRVAPKQVDLETRDDHLQRLSNLVDLIGRGSPSPLTGKALKALRFDPDREAMEMIPFQFLMVLRDIRFYTPDLYRWTTAPIIGQFLVETLGGLPAGIRPTGRHGSSTADRLDEERAYGHLARLLELEAGGANPHDLLHQAVSDAVEVGNGNFHAGLKLNPKRL